MWFDNYDSNDDTKFHWSRTKGHGFVGLSNN